MYKHLNKPILQNFFLIVSSPRKLRKVVFSGFPGAKNLEEAFPNSCNLTREDFQGGSSELYSQLASYPMWTLRAQLPLCEAIGKKFPELS